MDDRVKLSIVAADLGNGAFLKILCATCWHRRQYRAELEERRFLRRDPGAVWSTALGEPRPSSSRRQR